MHTQNWRDLFKDTKIIPVVIIDDAEHALPLVDAILEGGINVIEITLRTEAAFEAISRVRDRYPEIRVGAGTVVTERQARQAVDAGVHFGLAPGFNPKTVDIFRQAGIPFIPGVMTASEIERAYTLGCDLLKFFPAEQAGGARMLKALAAAYTHLNICFCPTGGISLSTMSDYLTLPAVTAIGGSWIAGKKDIAANNWDVIIDNARQALRYVRS